MPTMRRPYGASFLLERVEPHEVAIPEDMSDEERMMRRAIRDFARQEVEPVADAIERRDFGVIGPLFKKAAALGIFMAEVPEAYGGLGLSVLAVTGMAEARSYLGGLGSTVFAHQSIGTLPLVNFGTSQQIAGYLPRCMDGTLMAAFALTEPSSGSDAMNIQTRAVLNPERTHYLVTGTKQWITNAGWADLFILFAKVDGRQFTAFLLERTAPGLTVGQHERLLGLHGSSVCALSLENVAIPVENVLGEVGKGHKVALCTLNLGRLKMGASCAGNCKKALALAAEYAGQRVQFGRRIGEFGLIQRKLAEMAARTYAIESVAYRTAGLVSAALETMGSDSRTLDARLRALGEFSIECAMAKVLGSEAYGHLADETLQIYGGNGFSEEYPAARMYRDARIARIYEGTSEICRLAISRTILKRSADGDLDLSRAMGALKLPLARSPREASGDAVASLRRSVADLKRVYLFVARELLDHIGAERLTDHHHQPFLGSLADIAMETFAAESVVLRVLKIRQRRADADLSLVEALASLYVERAVDRARHEAREILAALWSGAELRRQIDIVEASLPLPQALLEPRAFVARTLVASGGTLPEL